MFIVIVAVEPDASVTWMTADVSSATPWQNPVTTPDELTFSQDGPPYFQVVYRRLVILTKFTFLPLTLNISVLKYLSTGIANGDRRSRVQ